MERGFDTVKNVVVNFQLQLCCWLIPIRIGLMIIGYINIILAVISVIGLSDDSFVPILMQVQLTILPDDATKPVPMVLYSAELAFNVILLCALYRKDLKLLRVYMKYCIAALIASIMFYSIVVGVIGIFIGIALVCSIVYQLYIIVLVRSMIVQLRLAEKNLQVPRLVMSTIIQEENEKKEKEEKEKEIEKKEVDVEAPVEHVGEKKPADVRLETVDESPKEETNEKEVKE